VITLSKTASDMAANFWRAWWAWLICFVVTILVSVFTPKKPKEELVGLVKGLTAENLLAPVPLLRKPEFYGSLSIIIFIALNIYFW
jgi:SSS family solute:Na+ symporter